MGRHYHDERRQHEPHYAPSIETFMEEGEWYYWFCMPGCLPDSDQEGPFATEEEALEHARLDLEDTEFDPTDSQIEDNDRRAFEYSIRSRGD